LPAGCKDLIDVLRVTARAKAPEEVVAFGTKITRNSQATIRVTELLGPVTDLLKSKGCSRALSVASCDFSLMVLANVCADVLSVRVYATEPSYNEDILKFLNQRGFEVPKQDETLPYPLIRPPSEPLALSSLAELMFRDVCGLNADSQVVIHHLESEAIS
jgi:hypothetical protein